MLTGIGAVEVRVPKARSRSGPAEPFRSTLLVPPYVQRSARVEVAIPWLYLHGVSTRRMREAAASLVGDEAARAEAVGERGGPAQAHLGRGVPGRGGGGSTGERVYLWADNIHSGLGGDDGHPGVLVAVRVNTRGREERFLPSGTWARGEYSIRRWLTLSLDRRKQLRRRH